MAQYRYVVLRMHTNEQSQNRSRSPTIQENEMERPGKTTIVFVGGGHAHLYSLKNADQFVRAGAHVILIGPERFHYYSGMGPGMLSRIYEPKQVRFDVQTMVESRGGKFVQGTVASIDPSSRTLVLDSGKEIGYDLLSCNVGSYIPMDLIPGAAEEAHPVKPIENLEKVRLDILGRIRSGIPKILVIGAGPAGVELAGNIWRLVIENNGKAEIILASSRDDVLPNLSEKVRFLAHESLVRRGIRIVPTFRAASMNKGIVLSQSGDEIAYDIAVLTIGIMPKQIFNNSGLETATDGSLMVNDYLQSTSYPEIFGGGDCISVKGKHLDHVGVYAVREAPVIFNNLMASLKKEPLKEFSPQQQYLLIFNLGDGNGIFVRHPFVIKAKWAFTLKDYIDRRFMSMFQVSGEAQESQEVSQ